MKSEYLIAAANDAGFLRQELREALNTATATEALLILPLIERASILRRDIDALVAALNEDAKGVR